MPDFIWLKRSAVALTFGAISPSAFADTTDLFCHESGMNPDVGLYVSIDGSAGTVAAWYTGINRDSVSPLPAAISDTQVTWSAPSASGSSTFVLDRNTGALNEGPRRFTCTRASKVF